MVMYRVMFVILSYPSPNGASALLIDATRKWNYVPVSLPSKEYMEKARIIWEEEGLPTLNPRKPWHGYELGHWPKKYSDAASMLLQGKLYELGEQTRRKQTEFII